MPQKAHSLAKAGLTLTGVADGKLDGDFAGASTAAFHKQFECDLITNGVEFSCVLKSLPPKSKEPRHRIAKRCEWPRRQGREAARKSSPRGPCFIDRPLRCISRRNGEIAARFIEPFEQAAYRFRRVLQIRVEHDELVVLSLTESGNDRTGKSSLVFANFDPNRMITTQGFNDFHRPIL